MNKFEGVCVFLFGLDKGFLGAGVTIIINSSLAHYVSKIENISGQIISVWLLFKGKLFVIVLGLYAGASAANRFDQASKINFFIAKAVNSSTFVMLGENFNENGSRKSASFNAKVDRNLDTMWAILKDVMIRAIDEVFSRYWFSEFDCSRNKHLSKFFKLELLVAKLVKYLRLFGNSGADRLIRAWSIVDKKETSNLQNMINNSVSLDSILHYLSNIKKRYYRSKYFKSKVARDILIKKIIKKHIENFCSNKEQMIKSVLKHPFCKVVLNYLIVNNELILLSDKVKSTVDNIMEE
ncbi:hypothetical protein G9A89_019711 [Geosiphon pyriformis]|nr:hypothetical protein G9A89_019711 [Geosiphon pyriformis]